METLQTIETLGERYINVFVADLLRYVIGAGGVYLTVNLLLSRWLAARKIRKHAPPAGQIQREILISLRTVVIFAANGLVIGLGAQAGIFTVYTRIAEFGWVYFVFSTAALIVLHDAWFYWTHRALHHPPLFRRLHRLHHRSHNPTPFTSYSFDTGEAVINAVFLPLVLLLFPVHPAAAMIFVTHMMLRNALGHCGYEIFPARRDGRPLFGWLTTVTHHDLHHAQAGWNLGLYFTWWDKWMGTEHPHYLAEFARVARPARLRTPTIAGALVLVATLVSDQAEAKTLSGTYASPGLGVVVSFGSCSGADATCGRLVWAWDGFDDLKLQRGAVMVRGLRWNGSAWVDGTLTDPETGWSFTGTITPLSGGRLQLGGCAVLLCDTQIWHSLESLKRLLAELPDD